MTGDRTPLLSGRLERALRWAATQHRGQTRRGGGEIPYVQHLAAVALVLERLGFDEDVVIAGLLHDVVEDTDATADDVSGRFGPRVAGLVAHCSERKAGDDGVKRPWIDRKRDHLAAVAAAPVEAKAVLLADKLHNLLSIAVDLADGRPVWTSFNAGRPLVLWYYREMIAGCRAHDPRIQTLADECLRLLAEVEAHGPAVEDPPPDRDVSPSPA